VHTMLTTAEAANSHQVTAPGLRERAMANGAVGGKYASTLKKVDEPRARCDEGHDVAEDDREAEGNGQALYLVLAFGHGACGGVDPAVEA